LKGFAGSEGEGGVGGREGGAVQEPRDGLTEGVVLEEEEGGREGTVGLAFRRGNRYAIAAAAAAAAARTVAISKIYPEIERHQDQVQRSVFEASEEGSEDRSRIFKKRRS